MFCATVPNNFSFTPKTNRKYDNAVGFFERLAIASVYFCNNIAKNPSAIPYRKYRILHSSSILFQKFGKMLIMLHVVFSLDSHYTNCMKQKKVDDTPVTKNDLVKALDNYPTKKDLAKALKNHPTRAEFVRELSKHPTHTDLADTEARIDENARQYRDQILNKMDGIVGELAQIREDRLFDEHDKVGLQEKVDNHEKRIGKLEAHTN